MRYMLYDTQGKKVALTKESNWTPGCPDIKKALQIAFAGLF
ncbi:hypothetical protein [Chitinophaga tropicalis]|nr:hypothetical protein [Chitinophaga tropicalis]